MKMYMYFLRMYFKILSLLWPSKAGTKAFYLFQRTRKFPLKNGEREFYAKARKFEVVHPRENIHAYELGDPNGKLVLLVHGWESNAGSMGAIANALAEEGFRVIALDLPAHGRSQLKRTNLRECREALRALIYHIRPTSPFSVISHSFGSAVTTLALTGSRYMVDTFIMLTSPNKLIDVFDEFKKQIALGDSAYEILLQHTEAVLNEPVAQVTVEAKGPFVNYRKMIIMHDTNDKVLPFSNSVRIHKALRGSELIHLTNVGHYRMLWNKEVVDRIQKEFTSERTLVYEEAKTLNLLSA